MVNYPMMGTNPAGYPPRKRPGGVTFLGVLAIIVGILMIPVGIIYITERQAIGLVFAVSGLCYLISGIGLLRLKRWAFWLVVLLSVGEVVFGIVALINKQTPGLIGMVVAIFILIYFFADRNVRAAFGV